MKIPKQARIEEIAKRIPMKEALEITVLARDNVFYQIYLKDKEVIWFVWNYLIFFTQIYFQMYKNKHGHNHFSKKTSLSLKFGNFWIYDFFAKESVNEVRYK